MKPQKLFIRKEMQRFGELFQNQSRDFYLKRNKQIIKWLKSIAWMNAHDSAWIEKTIEKLEGVK